MFLFKSSAIANYDKIFFDFKIESNSGEIIELNKFRNKIILVVNTASYCGFTNQYDDMQKLWENYKDKGLVVIGVPANNFKSQEPGNDGEIKEFCETTFGIDFPMTSKVSVKGDDAHPFYKWLVTQSAGTPKWNFHKYLIAPDGSFNKSFTSLTKPMSGSLVKAVEKILPNN